MNLQTYLVEPSEVWVESVAHKHGGDQGGMHSVGQLPGGGLPEQVVPDEDDVAVEGIQPVPLEEAVEENPPELYFGEPKIAIGI
jgi:hypothetical protein